MKNDVSKELQELANLKYERINQIHENELQKIIDTYGEEKVSNDGMLTVGEFSFIYSLSFDEIYYSDEKDYTMAMNFYYAEIDGDKLERDFKRHFPSYIKLQKTIHSIRSKVDCGFIAISNDSIYPSTTVEDDVGLKFNSLESFEVYINSFDETYSIFEDFLNEVEKYLKKMKFVTISDSGITKTKSNGARNQEILFKTDKNLFKIKIHSESYDFQSYAKLYVKDTSGWSVLISENPSRDFGIDISYRDDFKDDSFSSIITKYKKIAESVDCVVETC